MFIMYYQYVIVGHYNDVMTNLFAIYIHTYIHTYNTSILVYKQSQNNKMQKTQKQCFTFAGGPTMAPQFLKQSLEQALFCPDNSLLNINSNSKQYKQIQQKTKQNLTKLLNIPNGFKIWFCSGGVHLQFAGLGMNYCGNAGHDGDVVANYTTTGWFSKLAYNEGRKFLKAHSIAQIQKDKNGQFTLPDEFDYAPNAAFTHFVDNETVQGLEYPDDRFPFQPGVPLLDDCSSSILTKPIDWNKVSMAYAHAQKNCGISGITVMIIDEKFLKTNPCPFIPEVCDFRVYQQKGGFPFPVNSSAIFAMQKMLQHMLQNNGLNPQRYSIRSQKLYKILDQHKIYLPKVAKPFRSRINVTWQCMTPEISQRCINQGIQNGLYQFKGHRTVGGFRASLFNPVSDQAVDRLVQFLDKFGQKQSAKL